MSFYCIMLIKEEFHISRRMFCILDGDLKIAEPNLPLSHEQWFEENNWNNFEEITRGYINRNGDIFFYIGEGFNLNQKAEQDFFNILKELVTQLDLSQNSKIFGGLCEQNIVEFWVPRKEFGLVRNYLQN